MLDNPIGTGGLPRSGPPSPPSTCTPAASRCASSRTDCRHWKGARCWRSVATFASTTTICGTGLMFEPRGHADMYGAVITRSADADFDVFFLHNEGYSTMCGHAIIALTKLRDRSEDWSQGRMCRSTCRRAGSRRAPRCGQGRRSASVRSATCLHFCIGAIRVVQRRGPRHGALRSSRTAAPSSASSMQPALGLESRRRRSTCDLIDAGRAIKQAVMRGRCRSSIRSSRT